MLKMYCAAKIWMDSMKKRLSDEKGSHMTEVIIGVAIAVGLAILFRDQIGAIMRNILGGAEEATTDFLKAPAE